jgi:ABC-2 type transport system ATP-binding protein
MLRLPVNWRAMTVPAIAFERLRKVYGDLVAVDDLSLEIRPGEFFGLLGTNGAGKTTSLHTIAGLVKPTDGRVRVNGLDVVRDYRLVHRLVGITFQEYVLDAQFLNVREILVYQAGYFGISPQEAKTRADELLRIFSLWDKRSSRVQELSGGMKRRLMLAKALMHDPEILILDEPTAGADVELRHQLWEMLREFHKQGKTILLTTHYLEEAERLCERVAILQKGHMLALGAPTELTRERAQRRLEDVFLALTRSEKS